jgi:hypothetical protein
VILCDIDSLNKRINLYSTQNIFSGVREVRVSDYKPFYCWVHEVFNIMKPDKANFVYKNRHRKEANEFRVFHKITIFTNPNKRNEITLNLAVYFKK